MNYKNSNPKSALKWQFTTSSQTRLNVGVPELPVIYNNIIIIYTMYAPQESKLYDCVTFIGTYYKHLAQVVRGSKNDFM